MLASLLTVGLPVVQPLAAAPATSGRELTAVVDQTQVVELPTPATHIALHWPGSADARITVAFASEPGAFGADIPLETDDAGDAGDAGGPGAPDAQTYSPVIPSDGARFLRITPDRPLGRVAVVVIDAGASPDSPASLVAQAATSSPKIITRAQWGANESRRFDAAGHELWPPTFSPLQAVIVHHTAGGNHDRDPAATVRAIYYLDTVIRGWGDIGYNFLIDAAGRVYEGRRARTYAPGEAPTGEDLAGNPVRGAQASGRNEGTLGIAVLGTYGTVLPTMAARASLAGLIAREAERHAIDPAAMAVHYVNPATGLKDTLPAIAGHRDVANTACPGSLFYHWLPTLRLKVAALIASTTGPGIDVTPPKATSVTPLGADPTGSLVVSFGLVFSEPVTGLAAEDLVLGGTSAGWTISGIVGGGAGYTVTAAAASPTPGTITLTLVPGSVSDLSGNPGPAEEAVAATSWAPDAEAPGVALYATRWWGNDPGIGYDVTVTFSEPVGAFGPAAVVLGGSSQAATPWKVGAPVGAGASYVFSVHTSSHANGELTIDIPAGAISDLAGNPSLASNHLSIWIEHRRPTTTAPVTRLRSDVVTGLALAAQVTWSGSDHGGSGIVSYDVGRSVDGGPYVTFSTKRVAAAVNVSLKPGHTVRFRVRARDAAGNVGIWVAGPVIRPAVVQQAPSALVRYSGAWRTASAPGFLAGSARYAVAAGSSVAVTTSARSIAVVATRGPGRGDIRVYVDGTLAATVNLEAPVLQYRYVAYVRAWSSVGRHVLRVVVAGTPGRPRVDADAFEVLR
jgi:hypothetical protein